MKQKQVFNRKGILALVTAALLIIGGVVYLNTHRLSYIEKKLTAAIDQHCGVEGECELDLAAVFTEFDWDTVSVFIAGNPEQVMELGVYSEISDGIVFSKDGRPLKQHLSCYGFPEDVPPLISYYVEQTDPSSPYCISLPKEQAIVLARKYRFHDGSCKYSITASDNPQDSLGENS